MDNEYYKYKGKSWRPCPTKSDSNSFFHSAFGTRDREGEEYLDKQAHFRRMRWVTFLTYFTSETMPYGLADVLKKSFFANSKYRHASIDDKESFVKYVSDVISLEQKVTAEEIPILATLENIKIVVLSNTGPDPVIIVKPNPDVLGSYPNFEKAKEEVVLCLEGDVFSKLEPIKEISFSISNKIVLKNKSTKGNAVQPKNYFGKYKKGGSAGSKGVQYQVNLLAMVLSNAYKNLGEWKLSTENEDAGKFDDIVLEETEGATFIQSKHKEKKGKRITLNELTSTNSKNDDFSLPKYFLSYLRIKKKFKIKNVIICTNADVHEKVLKLLDQHEACSESILYFEEGDYSFCTLKDEMLINLKESIKSYYEENFKNKDIEEFAISDENLKDFQQHLQLYFNYPSLNLMEKIIDKSLSLIRCCTSSCGKIFSSEIYLKMMEWYQQEEGTYLTQTHARAMFSEIWREKYCQKLEEYEVSFHRDDLNFQQPMQVFHVITNGGYLLHVMKIYQAIRGDKKKILFVNLRDDIDIQKQAVEAFGLPQYTFLIIVWPQNVKEFKTNYEFGELKDILEKCTYKKIIVVAEDTDRFFQRIGWNKEVVRISRAVTFEDLHSLSQERLLKRKNIVFQGEKISLEKILTLQKIEDYGKALNTELLEKLIKEEEIKVGTRPLELDEYISRYYISRTFNRQHEKPLNKKSNHCEKKENILDEAQTSSKDSSLHCESPNLNEELHGELGKIYIDEMKEEEILSEANIYDVKEKIVIISDSAGTGKSTVLSKLALIIKESNPYLWVIRLELNDFTKILRDSLRNGRNTVNIRELLNSTNATKLKNHLEEFLFSTSQKVVLLLDGVDEISPDYTGLVLGLLKQCQEESNFTKIFVTTRPHMIDELEHVSKVKPVLLQPLSEQNQINFLTSYWANGLQLADDISKGKCKRYAEALVSKWMNLDTNEGDRFTTVPLQLRMIAEIFQENATSNESAGWEGCKEYVKGSEVQPNISERMNFTDLYRLFVEKKQYIFNEKGNPTGNTIASELITKTFDDCLIYHQSLALEVILGKEKLHLFSCYKRVDKNLETQMLKIGIVQKTKEEIHFIHRTFADFFVAECLFSEMQHNRTLEFQIFLIDTIFIHPQYNVTHTFFDSLLQEIENSLSPDVFEEYQSFNHERSIEFYKLQSHVLHLLAEGDCMAMLALILKCIDFKAVRGKEISILNFYTTHFSKDVHKNIFGNTLNLLQYLTKEAGVNIKDQWARTPLHYAAEKGHLEMVKFLIEAGADINNKSNLGDTALHLAASRNHLNTIKFLLERGADFNIKNIWGLTVQHTASFFGQLETVTFLVKQGLDINVVSCVGSTLLHLACEYNNLDTVKYLLDLGIDLNVRNNNGNIALTIAAYFGQLEIVKLLVERGSDRYNINNEGQTILHFACASGNLDIIKYFLEIGVDSSIRDCDGFTVFHWASQRGHLKTIKFLVEYGLDINISSNHGYTLLHLASANGSLDTIRSLLELGIDPSIRDNHGFTAFHLVDGKDQLEILKFFIDYGLDVNIKSADGLTLLHLTSADGRLEMAKFLLENGADFGVRGNDGCTPLHLAAEWGQLDAVKLLVEYGLGYNATTNNGQTPLHLASEEGHSDIVKYFLELGVDCNVRDYSGHTALHLAILADHSDIIKLLVMDLMMKTIKAIRRYI